MNILLIMGIAMGAGLLVSRAARAVKLPNVTAFLVAEWAGSEPVYDMLLNRSLGLMDRARTYIKESRHNLS